MSVFKILKKNRKYFSATKDGTKCKILIDDNSENLELGEQILFVDDISVRSRYGTDLIYKLAASADLQKESGVCTLRSSFYNQNLVDECHKLGGKWDVEQKAWVFPGFVEDKVELLDEKYNSKMINVEITFVSDEIWNREPVYLGGFLIASANGRDSGAWFARGISVIYGGAESGGSVKNWKTIINEGTVIRMSIPEKCLNDFDQNIKVLM